MAAILESFEMSPFEHVEYLPQLNTDYADISPLSSPRDCPSLSESFVSILPEGLDLETSRRPSIVSSCSSATPGWQTTSSNATCPATPVNFTLDAPFSATHLKTEQDLAVDSLYALPQFGDPRADMWGEAHAAEPSIELSGNASTMQLMSALGLPLHNEANSWSSLSHNMNTNPSLSRSMFGLDQIATSTLEQGNTHWSGHPTSPLRTIAPAAAFQPVYMPSPMTNTQPSTPSRRGVLVNELFGSSPYPFSTPVVPSQHEIGTPDFDCYDHAGVQVPDAQCNLITPEGRHSRSRLQRRRVGFSSEPKLATPVGTVIHERNEFACSHPGCEKRFKRQEHKKRHQKTVHLKNETWACWVPGCNTGAFTRTDNLTSHLKKTHGKKSPNQRNKYVATLDDNSKYFDWEYRGPIDEAGYPLGYTKVKYETD